MSENQFITFQKFNDRVAAINLGSILKDNDIEFLLEDTSSTLDSTFANNELIKEYRVKLKKQDFYRVEKLLLEISQNQIEYVEEDYYLLNFSNDELLELIAKKDEWSHFDFLLAQKLLKERGKEVNFETIELLKKQRIDELSKPKSNEKVLIYIGYISAVFGGVFSIFIGWSLLMHKKTLPNGDTIPAHSEADRKHGIRILIIGTICFFAWLIKGIILYDF